MVVSFNLYNVYANSYFVKARSVSVIVTRLGDMVHISNDIKHNCLVLHKYILVIIEFQCLTFSLNRIL